MRKTYHIEWGSHALSLGAKTAIMGVVNVTPDSFSDGGRFFSTESAAAQGETLYRQGADIIDIGGESTRPFSNPVTPDEELDRVIPVIRLLSDRIPIPISIDTTKSAVADAALAAGASIINDISALRMDEQMAGMAAKHQVPLILMHMKGTPKDMQVTPEYDDLLGDISQFFADAIDRAIKNGVNKSKIIIDPGIGFGKTFDHNFKLLRHLNRLAAFDAPVLVGSSRKAFIRNCLKTHDKEDIDPMSPMVKTGTQATVAAAILNGAHIVRIHDVAETRITAKIIDKMLSM
ncbi:MAG: dihydropteroate synthase [Desulfobacteraceae bacterium]|nr:dihydropteroate synthase [Desulfobacteraceae bacterium]